MLEKNRILVLQSNNNCLLYNSCAAFLLQELNPLHIQDQDRSTSYCYFVYSTERTNDHSSHLRYSIREAHNNQIQYSTGTVDHDVHSMYRIVPVQYSVAISVSSWIAQQVMR